MGQHHRWSQLVAIEKEWWTIGGRPSRRPTSRWAAGSGHARPATYTSGRWPGSTARRWVDRIPPGAEPHDRSGNPDSPKMLDEAAASLQGTGRDAMSGRIKVGQEKLDPDRAVLRGSWIRLARGAHPWLAVERRVVGKANSGIARRGASRDHLRPSWVRQIEPAGRGLQLRHVRVRSEHRPDDVDRKSVV